MIKYAFKDDHVILKNASKADPQKIGQELAKIAEAHGGRLMPEDVVNSARKTDNPLHPHFEWNDKLAAQSYRLDQARNIIRIIRIEDAENGDARPAYVSISDGGTSYRKLEEVVASRELQLIVLQQAERDLRAFEKRYHMLNDICSAVAEARQAIERKRGELETRAAA